MASSSTNHQQSQQQQQNGMGNVGQQQRETATVPQYSIPAPVQQHPQSKYSQLLAVIEELGKDIRPTYTGNKMSAERLKRSIIHARILVRECLIETEKAANRP